MEEDYPTQRQGSNEGGKVIVTAYGRGKVADKEEWRHREFGQKEKKKRDKIKSIATGCGYGIAEEGSERGKIGRQLSE